MGPAVRSQIVSRAALVDRLAGAARVAQISAPAGSGKTVLLRSWICEAGLESNVALVSAHSEERDPQRFWISVADALRRTTPGSKLVRPLTAAPDLDGWAITERLLKDLAPLEERIWLAIDDLHELSSAELRQLELLVTRTPPELRFVLSARHDVRLGLHRLRLEGELSEIRAADLAFSPADARALFEATGVELSGPELALLHERTEGWAAGLRLAALSLAGHPDPERFATDFSGSERTVADYLLAEVLDRQSEPVRRLLLRTSVLERVNGELADLLTGGSGGERILQDLEDAGAFVVCLDAPRSWFRYHRLFADLLQLELRRSAPGEVTALHAAAGSWYAEHGYPVEAVRHAQAALDWGLAVRVLSDHFLDLVLGGQGASAYQLLARFPADVIDSDAELATLTAAHELLQGSPDTAERYLARAVQRLASVPTDRRGRLQVELAIMCLCLAQRRGDLPAVVEEADRLLAPGADADAERPVDEDLRALALVTLDAAEVWALRPDDAELHLEQGTALARRTGWPWLEVSGLAHWAIAASFRSFELEAERSMQAIEPARQHGWTDEPVVAVAYVALAGARAWQARLADAEPLLDHAERALRVEVQPVAGVIAAGHALTRALDLAQPEGVLMPSLLHPVDPLLGQHARQTADHAPLSHQMLTSLIPAPADPQGQSALAKAVVPPRPAPIARLSPPPPEPLSPSETRVLRFLPTNLSAPEIAAELSVSVNTVRTHMRHVYAKLGAHHRTDAVERARACGLLTRSAPAANHDHGTTAGQLRCWRDAYSGCLDHR
jgi:LuxR family transcriptional regulator, maltose regulon positive regulatory protein